MPALKVVIDTNWLISATINKKSRRILFQLIADSRFKLLYSPELLKEYSDVIGRDKFRKYVTTEQTARFIKAVFPLFSEVRTESAILLSRDSKDNYLLGLCIDAKADFLVTGDPDLLVLGKVGPTQIVNMGEFFQLTRI